DRLDQGLERLQDAVGPRAAGSTLGEVGPEELGEAGLGVGLERRWLDHLEPGRGAVLADLDERRLRQEVAEEVRKVGNRLVRADGHAAERLADGGRELGDLL